MAASRVTGQVNSGNFGAATSGGVAFPGNTTTGNSVVVLVSKDGANPGVTVSSVTDSQGNTYAMEQRTSETSGGRHSEIWVAKNITGGTTPTVTVNMSGSASWKHAIYECAGISTTSPVRFSDKNGSASTTTTPQASAAGVSISETGVVAFVVNTTQTGAQTFTAGSGFTQNPTIGGRTYFAEQTSAGSLSGNNGSHTASTTTAYQAAMVVLGPDVATGVAARLIGGGVRGIIGG